MKVTVSGLFGDRGETAYEIQGSGMAAAGLGQAEQALRLANAGDAGLTQVGIDYSGVTFRCRLLDRYLTMARDTLGEAEAAKAWEEGQRMGFDDAMSEAMP